MNTSEEAIRRSLSFILGKLVSNEHIREVVEAAHKDLLSLIFSTRATGRLPADYVTRKEFSAFKDSLAQQVRSFIDEIEELERRGRRQ